MTLRFSVILLHVEKWLGLPGWAIGLLISAADTVITKAYAPILLFGALGGAVIGWIVEHLGAVS